MILWVFFLCFTQFGISFHCLSFDEFRDTAPLNCGGHYPPGHRFDALYLSINLGWLTSPIKGGYTVYKSYWRIILNV